jgi:gamma-glutamylputrescine oxidase
VAIIGGGIAGLTVADELTRRGLEDIDLFEAETCGAGATGRSSGFITPASELGLYELQHRFGDDIARLLWDAAQAGCDAIDETIARDSIACGRIEADSLFVASTERQFQIVEREHEARRQLGYESKLYRSGEMSEFVGTSAYGGAVRYGDSFAMDPYPYVRALASRLADRGVRIHEDTRLLNVSGRDIATNRGSLTAETIFFCVDFAAADLHVAKPSVYHAQTFLMISEPLDEGALRAVFPGRPFLVWDTDLIYQYFRLTADHRLLVGGGLLSRTYGASRPHDPAAIDHVLDSIRRRFPVLESVRFTSDWNGLIGVTKDFLPLAGHLRDRHYVALCSAGLPWSVVAAKTAVRSAFDGGDRLEPFLTPHRSFSEVDLLQPVVGRRVSFALSHAYAKSALRGTSTQIKRRKRIVVAAAVLLFATLLMKRSRK